MNENSKKKFTFFDIVIGAAILLVLAAVAYVLIISPMTKKTIADKQLEFVVEVQASTLDVLDLIHEGDTVTLSGKSEATLKSVHFSAAKQLVIDQINGKYKLSTVPEKYDISVTVSGNATETDTDISIGNVPVKVGASMSIEGKGYSINGHVLDMNLIDENEEAAKND